MTPFPFFRHRARRHAELRAELEAHLALALRDRMARGESREEAERAARRELGNEALIREVTRDMWGGVWLEQLAQDFRYAIRGLARSPGLTAAVVITLALGLGANAAVFSLLDRIFLREPAGVAQPERVVRLYHSSRDGHGQPVESGGFSYMALEAMRSASGGLGAVAAYQRSTRVPLGRGEDEPELTVVWAGANYFDLLGIHPERGRFFAPGEERMGAGARVAVVGDALWRTRFGADPAILGQTIELDRDRYVVVGVAPPGFRGTELDAADVWLPLALMPGPGTVVAGQTIPWYEFPHQILAVLARPAPGSTPRQLAAAATAGAGAAARATDRRETADTLVSVSTGPLIAARGPTEKASGIPITTRLAGVALIVLLIACANVANLLLARGMRRRREIAVRLALGIGRRRLVAQLVTESLLLSALAACGALLLGIWGGEALRAALLPRTHWAGPVLGGRAVLVILLATLACGLLTGLAPALQTTRPVLTRALRDGPREGGGRRSRLRDALIVLQAALSVVLLVGAGLFVRSLERVEGVDTGYDEERLVYSRPTWEGTAPAAADREAGLARAAERLRRMPGVEAVALGSAAPMEGYSISSVFLPGGPLPPSPEYGYPSWMAVSPSYFATVGLRVLRGRAFDAGDGAGGPRSVIVNRTMARALWPGQDPLGRCIRVGADTSPCTTVIGVVENGRQSSVVEQPTMQFYLPLDTSDTLGLQTPRVLVVRARPGRLDAAAAATTRPCTRPSPPRCRACNG